MSNLAGGSSRDAIRLFPVEGAQDSLSSTSLSVVRNETKRRRIGITSEIKIRGNFNFFFLHLLNLFLYLISRYFLSRSRWQKNRPRPRRDDHRVNRQTKCCTESGVERPRKGSSTSSRLLIFLSRLLVFF